LNITQEKIEVGEAAGRLLMTWFAFIATFATTAIFLGILVWCIVRHDDWAAKATLGVINGILLSLLHVIFRNIFPSRPAPRYVSKLIDPQ
jgi:hypothetical protein